MVSLSLVALSVRALRLSHTHNQQTTKQEEERHHVSKGPNAHFERMGRHQVPRRAAARTDSVHRSLMGPFRI